MRGEQERELRGKGNWEREFVSDYSDIQFFNFFLKKRVLNSCRVPCVSLPCPRVRKNIKILDTSFGVSDTDFRVSVFDTGHACSVPCPCITGCDETHFCILFNHMFLF